MNVSTLVQPLSHAFAASRAFCDRMGDQWEHQPDWSKVILTFVLLVPGCLFAGTLILLGFVALIFLVASPALLIEAWWTYIPWNHRWFVYFYLLGEVAAAYRRDGGCPCETCQGGSQGVPRSAQELAAYWDDPNVC